MKEAAKDVSEHKL